MILKCMWEIHAWSHKPGQERKKIGKKLHNLAMILIIKIFYDYLIIYNIQVFKFCKTEITILWSLYLNKLYFSFMNFFFRAIFLYNYNEAAGPLQFCDSIEHFSFICLILTVIYIINCKFLVPTNFSSPAWRTYN